LYFSYFGGVNWSNLAFVSSSQETGDFPLSLRVQVFPIRQQTFFFHFLPTLLFVEELSFFPWATPFVILSNPYPSSPGGDKFSMPQNLGFFHKTTYNPHPFLGGGWTLVRLFKIGPPAGCCVVTQSHCGFGVRGGGGSHYTKPFFTNTPFQVK